MARTALVATRGSPISMSSVGAAPSCTACAAGHCRRSCRAGACASAWLTSAQAPTCAGNWTRRGCSRRKLAPARRRSHRGGACSGAFCATRTTERRIGGTRRGDGVHVSSPPTRAAGVFRGVRALLRPRSSTRPSPPPAPPPENLAERAGDAGLPKPEVMLVAAAWPTPGPRPVTARGPCSAGPAGGGGSRPDGGGRRVRGAVCLDMGGTSCDVSVAREGRVASTGGREVGGRALALPMVDAHTVGAGGGSIAWATPGARSGSARSAGPTPVPASYGRGGAAPTVTDANLGARLPRARSAARRQASGWTAAPRSAR